MRKNKTGMVRKATSVIAKAIAEAGPDKLPCSNSKARFENGTKVELRDLFFGRVIFSGVVVGKGVDEYGEYQEVNITSPASRAGNHKVRLMDLQLLRKVG